MDTTIVTPAAETAPAPAAEAIGAAISALDSALNDLVSQGRKTREVIQNYANNLIRVVGAEWWLLKGKDKKPVKACREMFVERHLAEGFTKPYTDVMWQRVKEASGYVTPGNRVKGSNDVDAKNLDDLRTMINRIFKAEEAGTDTAWSDEKAVLIDLFGRMGGDVDKLG